MGHVEQRITEIAGRLYALPPEEFVAARNAEAKQATGRLAQAVKALRRPTLSAWLVNLLAARRGDQLHELLAIGERMRDAHRDLKGQELRELSTRRQAVTTSLIAQARDLAAEHGKRIRDDAIWEAETTLRAALADPEISERVRTGTLDRPAGYNGLGLLPSGPDLADAGTDAGAAAGTGAGTEAGARTEEATPAVPRKRQGRAKLRVILGGRSAEPDRTETGSASAGSAPAGKSGTPETRKKPETPAETRERKAAAARAEAERALADAERQLEEVVAAEKQVTRKIGEIAAAFDELRQRERRLRTEQAGLDRERRRTQRRRAAAEKAVADARRRQRPR